MMRSLPLLFSCLLLSGSLVGQRGGIAPGPWSRNEVPDGWIVHLTKNYQIQSQCGEEKAERLGDHMETMNKVYRKMFPPGKDGAKQQVIKLLKDRDAYLAYGAPPGSAAYYSRTDREMVCYDTGKWSDEANEAPITGDGAESALERRLRQLDDLMKMDLLGCAAHEGWHQYFSWYVVSMVTLPSWINEGMGDYFYTAAPREVRGRRMPAKLGQLNNGRLMVLKAAVRAGRFVPLEQLITMSKQDFYADPSVCYAEGWAFCQFLLHSGNRRYENVIPNFVRFVKDDTNFDVVRDRAFKGIDLAELEQEFKAWIDQQQLPKSDEHGDGDAGGKADPGSGEPGKAGAERG